MFQRTELERLVAEVVVPAAESPAENVLGAVSVEHHHLGRGIAQQGDGVQTEDRRFSVPRRPEYGGVADILDVQVMAIRVMPSPVATIKGDDAGGIFGEGWC